VNEFSFQTRAQSLERFKREKFDLLVIGGGIIGAAVARDASSRGMKVALVERKDFAFGTSSRSSKLIHGGLRYLQNMEFHLVFEALSERALLLKTVPHMVRPLPFFLPVYDGDKPGKGLLSMGLWLYDLLSLFRAPGFHKRLSKDKLLEAIPYLKKEGLQGGFSYFDASMWDDVLTVETLRSANRMGAAVANYVEALSPVWTADRITGFRVCDLECTGANRNFEINASRVVVCAGPWTDQMGSRLSKDWKNWIEPSKGVHLIFDLKRIPIPGAMVMTNKDDGRISFVIPRPDFGAGVVIVGTTDGPAPALAEDAGVAAADVDYLMALLNDYFPELKLRASDIISAYVGVRPLFGSNTESLQKVSREHHIDVGPGGTVVVAGGKYTTHRKMGEEIVDFALRIWREDLREGKGATFPRGLTSSRTKAPVNPKASPEAIDECRRDAARQSASIPEELFHRYGAGVLDVLELQKSQPPKANSVADPDGFPMLSAQLRHAIRSEMVMHLEDFYLRRLPLYSTRADHGMPWAEALARVWGEERGATDAEVQTELSHLRAEVAKRSEWKLKL